MYLGAEDFNPKLLQRVNELYGILGDKQSQATRAQRVTLFDMLLLSIVFNKLNRVKIGSHKALSASNRLLEVHTYLTNYIKCLQIYNGVLIENVKSPKGTSEAIEEMMLLCVSLLLNIMFFTLENANAVVKLLPSGGYTLTDIMKLNLDKAFLAKHGFPNPSNRESKLD